MAAKSDRKIKVVADNRKARFNYEIGEVFEAGVEAASLDRADGSGRAAEHSTHRGEHDYLAPGYGMNEDSCLHPSTCAAVR